MVDEKRIQNIVNKTVEKAVQSIAREEKIPALAAAQRFKRSKTYDMMTASETGMWQESVEYILYEYKLEQTKVSKEKKLVDTWLVRTIEQEAPLQNLRFK